MTSIDPTKSPDEIVEDIEAAEESKDINRIIPFITLTSSTEHGGAEDWAEAAEASLDALYRLLKGGASSNSSNDDDTNSDGCLTHHLQTVFTSLNAWKEEEAIVEVGLGCLVAIAQKANTIAKASGAAGDERNGGNDSLTNIDVGLVLDLMKEFGDEPTIQEQACLAIEGLALWKTGWRDQLAEGEGIREELANARNDRITNERNKAYPLRAAKALGINLE